MSLKLCRIARRAKAKPQERFTSLAHLLNENFLHETWRMLNRKGAAGIDRVSMTEYEENLEEHLKALVTSMKALVTEHLTYAEFTFQRLETRINYVH